MHKIVFVSKDELQEVNDYLESNQYTHGWSVKSVHPVADGDVASAYVVLTDEEDYYHNA